MPHPAPIEPLALQPYGGSLMSLRLPVDRLPSFAPANLLVRRPRPLISYPQNSVAPFFVLLHVLVRPRSNVVRIEGRYARKDSHRSAPSASMTSFDSGPFNLKLGAQEVPGGAVFTGSNLVYAYRHRGHLCFITCQPPAGPDGWTNVSPATSTWQTAWSQVDTGIDMTAGLTMPAVSLPNPNTGDNVAVGSPCGSPSPALGHRPDLPR